MCDLNNYFRDVDGNLTTLPEYFKQNRYITAGFDKVFHPGPTSGYDDSPSWTEPYYHAPNLDVWPTFSSGGSSSWLAVPQTITERLPLPDDRIAESAMKFLDTISIESKHFFVAVGFHKPHLPFVFPAEFIKYYPPEKVHLPPNQCAPVGMPPIVWHNHYNESLIVLRY